MIKDHYKQKAKQAAIYTSLIGTTLCFLLPILIGLFITALITSFIWIPTLIGFIVIIYAIKKSRYGPQFDELEY